MTPARIPDDVRAHVKARDNGCIGHRAGMAGACEGGIELDHILNGGMGLKGPSTPENLASLCEKHHRTKSETAGYWRPHLVALVAKLEAKVQEGLWPVEA